MGKRVLKFPFEISGSSDNTENWNILSNRFAGRILFKYNFYHLATADLSALDKIGNKWFIEQLLDYSGSSPDVNFIPALENIASNAENEEGMRQRSSEIIEKMEAELKGNKKYVGSAEDKDRSEKLKNAFRMLTAPRSPQTAEILRLLRERPAEMKRLALSLIGKYKITDMTSEVCTCLNVPGIKQDALNVLEALGNDAGNELIKFYLLSSGNLSISRAILRLIGKICPEVNSGFLMEIILSSPRQLKEIALGSLINCRFKVNDNERIRIEKHIWEGFELLSWLTSIKAGLNANNDYSLGKEIDKEYSRWKGYINKLLYFTYKDKASEASAHEGNPENGNIQRFIPELAHVIYGDTSGTEMSGLNDAGADLKRLKKLNRYFPVEVPRNMKLYEDIINCDYNQVSIWTKACTVRNISAIDDRDIAESVIALLFSPERVLQEEAAGLLARSGQESFRSASERIPAETRNKLSRIVSGQADQKELIFEKTRFLALCLLDIREDELLFLAEKISFIRDTLEEIPCSDNGAIFWRLTSDDSVPHITIMHDRSDFGEVLRDIGSSDFFYYVLGLDTVEEFIFQYPDNSFTILDYIDKNED